MDRSQAAASFSSRWPAAEGNSYMPASRPRAGRLRIMILLPDRIRKTVLSSIFFAAFGGIMGSSFSIPCCRATQASAQGHSSQRGSPPGRQIMAPRSIRAWLKSPGLSAGMIPLK